MFEFGDKYRDKYDGSLGVVKRYYASVSGFKDELLWAALWLYKATDNEEYLKYVINKANSFGGIGWAMTEFSWDVQVRWPSTPCFQGNFSNFSLLISNSKKQCIIFTDHVI